MLLQTETSTPSALQSILFGSEEAHFILEIMLRSFIMFIVVLVALRLMGKRGIKQLSVFELVIILTLGSAAGDPMFYKEVGIISCIVVFTMMLGLYRLTTHLIAKNKKLETLIEGKPVCVIEDGKFCVGDFRKEGLAQDEFFAELRILNISHLGQVEQAWLETSGEISVYYYEDEDVRYGLPIRPREYDARAREIKAAGIYACSFCGNTQQLQPAPVHHCRICNKETWNLASNKRRIS